MFLSGTLLNSDNLAISYYHYKRRRGELVVIAHGFYSSKDDFLLQKLFKRLSSEYDVFIFDFRGHGKSRGVFMWTSKENDDLISVLRFLKKENYRRIGLIGFSLGASISINTVANNPGYVDSLICISSPSEFEKIDYKWWELDFQDDFLYTLFNPEGRRGKGVRPGPFWLKKEKPILNIEKVNVPVLYIHGSKDWVVKAWHSQALFNKTNTKKKIVIIDGGPHAEYLMKQYSKEIVNEILSWFDDTLKQKGE